MKSILISFLASLTAFFLPVQGVLIAVAVAISLDTITGIYKAKKLKRPIISKKASDIIAKMFVYELCVILIFLIDHYLLAEFVKHWFSADHFFTKIVALLLIGIELTSIKENIEEASGKNIIKWLVGTLKRSKEIKDDVIDLTK